MKKILFLVNGLGLGNSIRIYSIIQRLKKENTELYVVTSGNGKWFYNGLNEIKELFFINEIYYGAKNDKISIINTLKSIIGTVKVIKNNSNKLNTIINKIKPNVIVTDSVYMFPSIKKFGIPIIGVNNSDLTVDYFKKFRNKPNSILGQYYFIEQLDYFYHKIIPDVIISPCFLSEDIRDNNLRKKIRRVGPIVRLNIKKRTKKKIKRGAIMLSGSNFGVNVKLKNKKQLYNLDIIGRSKPQNWQHKEGVIFHGKIKDNIALLNNIDFCVVNGGYSALSELFWAEVPMIVIPVPNHSEQWTNAKQIVHAGCGILGNEENYEDLITELNKNFEKYETNYDALKIDNHGADNAAKIILDI